MKPCVAKGCYAMIYFAGYSVELIYPKVQVEGVGNIFVWLLPLLNIQVSRRTNVNMHTKGTYYHCDSLSNKYVVRFVSEWSRAISTQTSLFEAQPPFDPF